MKAILKYGNFTSMIELPQMRPTVSVLKPIGLSFLPLEETSLIELKPGRLDFRVVKQLDSDIWLYEFDRES